MEGEFRSLRIWSLIVTFFAALILLTGIAQIGLAGIAVSQEYERIEQEEARARAEMESYGYRYRPNEMQREYQRTSTAFFTQGRFLPSDESLEPDAPAVISLIVLLFSALAFAVSALVWVWRAYSNLKRYGIRTKQSPALAVAAYLIPIANLFLPFEGMRELYNRSNGENEEHAHSPADQVSGWWTTFIAGLIIFNVIIVKFVFDIATNLIIMTPLWMEFGVLAFALLLLFGSASLFAGLARSISAAQQEYLPDLDVDSIQQEQAPRPAATAIQG